LRTSRRSQLTRALIIQLVPRQHFNDIGIALLDAAQQVLLHLNVSLYFFGFSMFGVCGATDFGNCLMTLIVLRPQQADNGQG